MTENKTKTGEQDSNGTEHWVWCNGCTWTATREQIEGLVRLRTQEGEDIDTDEVAKEQAENHARYCTSCGDVEIDQSLRTDTNQEER